MHDLANLERRGLPAAMVASTAFAAAATAQSRALGTDPVAVFVPHPIQNRTNEEMRALADACLEAVLAALTDRRDSRDEAGAEDAGPADP